MFLVPRLFGHPFIRKKDPNHKEMPEANVPEVGHGPKMGQNEFALVLWGFRMYSCRVS